MRPSTWKTPTAAFLLLVALAEIMLTIFGYGPASVDASEAGRERHRRRALRQFRRDQPLHERHGILFRRRVHKGPPVLREIDISMCYRHECEAFARMLRTGGMNHSYEELVYPVFTSTRFTSVQKRRPEALRGWGNYWVSRHHVHHILIPLLGLRVAGGISVPFSRR
jgi:hypothetical protein